MPFALNMIGGEEGELFGNSHQTKQKPQHFPL